MSMNHDNPSARNSKLVKWDADYYKSLSDDDCIVCLTEREVYLLGQIIDQLTWVKTRWQGDISGLDFKGIAGNLEHKLSERMTCNQLQQILDTVEQLQITINDLVNPSPDFEHDVTVINDNYTDEELAEHGYNSGTCTTTDKDKLYSGINTLVRYMHQVNVDFLEELSQAGNLTDQIDRFLSAIPAFETLPIDEAFNYATFFIDELLEEYNATVDEDLLQTVVCDLFCIAVNSGCSFNFYDVYDYYAAKVQPSLSNAATTFLDLVQFALSGTFTGDDYYYYLTYFQLALAGLQQKYFSVSKLDTYIMQFLSGLNSPDNDWTIFCITCPTQYRLFSHDFSNGMGHFEIDDFFGSGNLGTYANGRVEGTGTNNTKHLSVAWNDFDPTWRVLSVKIYLERVNGVSFEANNDSALYSRPTPDSHTGSQIIIFGNDNASGEYTKCNTPVLFTDGGNQLYMYARINKSAASPAVQVYLHKIEIIFAVNHAPTDTRITEDNNLCV